MRRFTRFLLPVSLVAFSTAHAQGLARSGNRFSNEVRSRRLPAPDDSLLARGLVFRGIGPALMGGRSTEIAVAERRDRLPVVQQMLRSAGAMKHDRDA